MLTLSVGCQNPEKNLNAQASAIIKLPSDATIKEVFESRRGNGDGTVSFYLSNTHSSEEWLNIIWKMNPPPSSCTIKETAYNDMQASISASGSDGVKQSLTYNKNNHLYEYQFESHD